MVATRCLLVCTLGECWCLWEWPRQQSAPNQDTNVNTHANEIYAYHFCIFRIFFLININFVQNRKLAINLMHWTENMKKNVRDNSATPSGYSWFDRCSGFPAVRAQVMHVIQGQEARGRPKGHARAHWCAGMNPCRVTHIPQNDLVKFALS